MVWAAAYWDAIEELYYDPDLLGMKPIKADKLAPPNQDLVAFPVALLRKGGRAYSRPGTTRENLERLQRLEVPLNHLFDICFSITPSSVLASIFLDPLGITEAGVFTRVGREIASRYDGFQDNTGTQQDGFFVAEKTLLGVELKTGSRTSRGQLLKYVALMMAEEVLTGRRASLVLVFVDHEVAATRCFAQCGVDDAGRVSRLSIAKDAAKGPPIVAAAVARDESHFADCLVRLKVAHLSWRELAFACRSVAGAARDAGGMAGTLDRLMTGMAEAIEAHPKTGAAQAD